MAQTPMGARLGAARKLGLSLDQYLAHEASGEKWCTACKGWHPRNAFRSDRSRRDGLSATCSEARNARVRKPPDQHLPHTNPATGRPGPAPNPPRDGDKQQARARTSREKRLGNLPNATDVPCMDCGRTSDETGLPHDYDHFAGYSAEHHRSVQPVCRACHAKREAARRQACKRGHPFTPENVRVNDKGHRQCRTCERDRERQRGPRGSEYWRKVNTKRRKKGATSG